MMVLGRFLRARPPIPTSIFSSMASRSYFSSDCSISAANCASNGVVPTKRGTEEERKIKPGKALFFLALSYHDELPGKRLLIATKILEGTHYVLHPNGSAMYVVNYDEPSVDSFPWTTGADALPLDVKRAFTGEGIANGYGFRYPGSKPGSLFEIQDGLLAFVWKESGAILTLRRLNLQELLKTELLNFQEILSRSMGNACTSMLVSNSQLLQSRKWS